MQLHRRSRSWAHAVVLGLALSPLLAACTDETSPTPSDDGSVAPGPDSSALPPIAAPDGAALPGVDAGTDASGGSNPPVASAWCAAKAAFDSKCGLCHKSPVAYGAPMPIAGYPDTQAAAPISAGKKVYEAIAARTHDAERPMPPRDQPQLTPAELSAIDAWIAAGAPAGADPTCAGSTTDAGVSPDSGAPSAAWPTDCDNTYKILARSDSDATAKYPVQARTQEYKTFIIDPPWGSEEVQAIAFRPITDNTTVLHHWILYQNNNDRPGAFLNGWAPGSEGGPLPADVGQLMPRGARSLLIQFHYWNLATNSKVEPDASGVEICTVNKPKFRKNSAEVFQGFSSFVFQVNRGELNKNVVANCRVRATQPVHLLTSSPHMHGLGVYAKLEVLRANGMTETVHDAVFDFDDQRSIPIDVTLNNGDTVRTTCTYSFPQDDSTHVRNNRPMQSVGFGQFTEDEMCYNFTLYYPAGGLSCGF